MGFKMSKNKGKGGKSQRRLKSKVTRTRELKYKEDGEEYARVEKFVAPGILEATCADGVTRSRCQIRGKMKNRIWIKKDDIILLRLGEVGVHDAIVILKYTEEEVRKLKQAKELPEYMCTEIENIETREKLDDGFMVFNDTSEESND